jgi:hypothetical protein
MHQHLIYLLMGPMCVVHLFNASMCLVSFGGVYHLDLCSGLISHCICVYLDLEQGIVEHGTKEKLPTLE